MTTVVNNPPAGQASSSNGIGLIIGVFLVIVVGIMFVYYGLPAIRRMTITPQINVPSKIDVNVTQPSK